MAVNMLETRVSLGVVCRSKRPSLFCALTKINNRLLPAGLWATGAPAARAWRQLVYAGAAMSHGAKKTGDKKLKPGEHEPIDFLATGFQVTTNCAFSVRIMEGFKLKSDKLASGADPSAQPQLVCHASRAAGCVRATACPFSPGKGPLTEAVCKTAAAGAAQCERALTWPGVLARRDQGGRKGHGGH